MLHHGDPDGFDKDRGYESLAVIQGSSSLWLADPKGLRNFSSVEEELERTGLP